MTFCRVLSCAEFKDVKKLALHSSRGKSLHLETYDIFFSILTWTYLSRWYVGELCVFICIRCFQFTYLFRSFWLHRNWLALHSCFCGIFVVRAIYCPRKFQRNTHNVVNPYIFVSICDIPPLGMVFLMTVTWLVNFGWFLFGFTTLHMKINDFRYSLAAVWLSLYQHEKNRDETQNSSHMWPCFMATMVPSHQLTSIQYFFRFSVTTLVGTQHVPKQQHRAMIPTKTQTYFRCTLCVQLCNQFLFQTWQEIWWIG